MEDVRLGGPARVAATFPATVTAPAAARAWASTVLAPLGLTGSSGDIMLVLSELVTNAVLHGAGPVEVSLDHNERDLTITVCDRGPGVPALRVVDGDRDGGRGLRIVNALSVAWGVDPGPDGKAVWSTIPLT